MPVERSSSFSKDRDRVFICGNDEATKNVVSGIRDQFGWQTEEVRSVPAKRKFSWSF